MKKVLAALLVAVLALAISLPVAIAAPTGPELQQAIFYYAAPDGTPGKGPPPGKGPGGGEEPSKDNTHYELLGPKWGTTPVSYVIDPDFAPEGAVAEIEAAFEAWDAATSTELFNPAFMDSSESPSLGAPDGVNTVTFRILAGTWTNALAVTSIWYTDVDGSGTMTTGDLMYDTDVIFNLKFKWAIDPDGEGPLKADVKGGYYDVQNVATHEAGHVVGLDDLYSDIYSELTMYGYAAAKETKKISLETGDILGTQDLYGE